MREKRGELLNQFHVDSAWPPSKSPRNSNCQGFGATSRAGYGCPFYFPAHGRLQGNSRGSRWLSVNRFLIATKIGVALEIKTYEGSKWYGISIPRYLNQIDLRTGCQEHNLSGFLPKRIYLHFSGEPFVCLRWTPKTGQCAKL